MCAEQRTHGGTTHHHPAWFPEERSQGGMAGNPGWIRTNDHLLRRQMLYPAELRGQGLQRSYDPLGLQGANDPRRDDEDALRKVARLLPRRSSVHLHPQRSGRSVARYRACFGSRRSSVRIWPPRQQKVNRGVGLFVFHWSAVSLPAHGVATSSVLSAPLPRAEVDRERIEPCDPKGRAGPALRLRSGRPIPSNNGEASMKSLLAAPDNGR